MDFNMVLAIYVKLDTQLYNVKNRGCRELSVSQLSSFMAVTCHGMCVGVFWP